MAPPEYLRRDEVEDIVKRTVKATLQTMGVDTSDPMEMQRDFQSLREWRITFAAVKSKGLLVTVGLFATGLVTAIVLGIKYVIKQP